MSATPSTTPSEAPSVAQSATSMETNQRPWWLHLIGGIAAMTIGAILLFGTAQTKVDTWVLLVTVLGVWWLVSGMLDLVSMFIDHTAWLWKLIMGIISIMAGGYILMYPIAAAAVLPQVFVLVLGIWGLVNGLVLFMLGFRGGGAGAMILGAIELLFGAILIANYGQPGWGLSMVWAAALWGLVGGFIAIVHAFSQRSAAAKT